MVHQLFYGDSIGRILLKGLIEEVPCLLADVDVGGDGDLFFDYFDEFFLLADLEWVLPH